MELDDEVLVGIVLVHELKPVVGQRDNVSEILQLCRFRLDRHALLPDVRRQPIL